MSREEDLSDAFNVHAALVAVEAKRPHLKSNPRWRLIRQACWRRRSRKSARMI